jgi:diguanylate cyclase (GGDEF)-like protein/PAS domain S-box-containing protein
LVESAALAVAGGDLEARAPATGPRELARLGETLNQMTDALLDASKRRELEEALRRSEQQFRSLIENASDIITVMDPDGAMSFVGPSVQRVLGYQPEELIGKNAFDFIHPDDLPDVLRNFSLLVQNPAAPQSAEFRFRHADGSWRTLEAIGRNALNDSGLAGVVINARDISERKHAEEALKEAEAKYRTLVEQLPAITYIDVVDEASPAGFTPVYFSPQIETMLGYSPEELNARPELWAEMIHPDDRERALAEDALHYATGEPMSHEYRLIARDGRVVWVHDRAAVTVRDAAGGSQYSHGVLLDVTERKQAEEALRESEERTRQIVETAYDALISMDARGVITAWNSAAEAIFGWSREEVIGRIMGDTILPPQYREAHLKGVQRFLATGEGPVLNQRIEITALHRDGHEFPVELAVWAVRSGDAFTFNAFVHDITKRKEAEEALRLLNQELEKEQKEIAALNRSLERKVKERTRELRIANKELRERNRQLLTARAQAVTDSNTGLHNHRAFHERVRDEVSRAQVNGTEIGMIMMDIDGFKSVNDSLGHLAGDRILRRLARTLARAVPQDDAYRYGGDEFAVLLPGASHEQTAAAAERLRRAVETRTNGNGEGVTISLGVACYPDTASSAEELIYGSDAAMYWAKSAGKNRVGDWSELVRHRAEGALPWYTADRAIRAPDTVAALVAALAAKDPATASHTERCSWYAARLAEELGLGERDASIVRLSSLLHDIGKLAVPDDILFKPGPLDDHEWDHMRRHPTTALHILGQIRSVADATPAILHHHEHFDGSGYPDGLAGDRIPIASRILLVTDAFDAMTTDRPYRRAMPVEAAVEELRQGSGSQFDPEVVEAFLRILARDGAQPLTWSETSERPRLEPSASPISAGQPSG